MQRPYDSETKEPIPPPRPVVLMAFDCAVCCGRPDVSCGACGHTAGQARVAKVGRPIPMEVTDCTPDARDSGPPHSPGTLTEAISAIRAAGGSDWDKIGDAEAYLGRDEEPIHPPPPSIQVASAEFADEVSYYIDAHSGLPYIDPARDLAAIHKGVRAVCRELMDIEPEDERHFREILGELVGYAIVAAEILTLGEKVKATWPPDAEGKADGSK